MKIAYIDVETTGLDPKVHAIWSIGAIFEIDGEEVSRIDYRCAPFRGVDKVSKKALEIGGITMDDLNSFPPPQETKIEFEDTLGRFIKKFNKTDKFHFVGYNAPFDYQFLREWYLKANDPYFGSWFWHPPIDVMNLAGLYCMGGRQNVVNFKLQNIAKQIAGIELSDEAAHDALADIEVTRDLFLFLKRWAYEAWKEDDEKGEGA